MIELTWGSMRDPEFVNTMKGLQRQKLEFKTSLKLLNITKKIQDELKKSDEMIHSMRDKFMSLDEKTKLYTVKPGSEKDCEKFEMEFLTTKFTVNIPKIKHSEISSCELSAVDILKLEPLLEDDTQARKLHAVKSEIVAGPPNAPA